MRLRDLESLDFPRVKEVLASFTQTPIGREKALSLSPFPNQEEVEKEFFRLSLLWGNRYALSGIKDLRETLIPLKEGMCLTPNTLAEIRQTILGLGELKRVPKEIWCENFSPFFTRIEGLAEKIGEAIDDFGEMKPEFSPLLKRLNEEAKSIRAEIIKKLEGIRRENPDLFWDGEITIRNGRYCLPLKSFKKGRLPAIVHDLSESEKTLFVEPISLVELGNQLVRREREMAEERRKILLDLTKGVVKEKSALLSLLDFAGLVDLWQAKISFAQRFGGTKPTFIKDDSLEIIGARHPLLLLKGVEVVPLDLVMKGKKVLVVSGPNAGGKTCLLKTVGLVVLLSQCGIFPPCQRAVIPFFDNLFTDIGENESLEEALSAFTAHLLNIKEILTSDGNKKSLILLDELGGSTSPEEGGALACALIEELKRRDGITIVTTHLTVVKLFAYNDPEVLQGSMEFKGKPTYQLILGLPGESSALEIASLLDFPQRIIIRAQNLRGENFISFSEKVKELAKEISDYQNRNRSLAEKEKKVQELNSLLEKRLREWEKKEKEWRREFIRAKETFLKENREKVEKLISELRQWRERPLRDEKRIKEIIKESEELFVKVMTEIKEERKKLITQRREVKVGDRVRIVRFDQEGEVLALDGELAKVSLGRLTMKIPSQELEVVEEKVNSSEGSPVASPRKDEDTLPPFSPLLNIRGEEKIFALEKVERFLEDAILYGCKEIKLLHGKGKGILRQAIWDFLAKDKRISEFREGRPEEGGSGVTVVKLK
ncbi:MAG: Smr/MutS family protein [candidate division WOR-3 bacterium]